MSTQRSPYRPYLGIFHSPVRAALQALQLRRLAQKWARISHPDPDWPLPGIQQGHRMTFGSQPDTQYLAPSYEPKVCGAIQRLVKPGFICADVGAHIGYMTLLMAKLTEERGKVYAFEALPDNARRLRRNADLNGYQQRVVVENKAVCDRTCDVEFHLGPSSFQSSLVLYPDHESITVPGTSLDAYFADFDRLDFMKMDIEGAEIQGVAGMKRIASDLRPIALIEVHAAEPVAIEPLIAAGYDLYDLELRPITPADRQRAWINHYVCIPAEKIKNVG